MMEAKINRKCHRFRGSESVTSYLVTGYLATSLLVIRGQAPKLSSCQARSSYSKSYYELRVGT